MKTNLHLLGDSHKYLTWLLVITISLTMLLTEASSLWTGLGIVTMVIVSCLKPSFIRTLSWPFVVLQVLLMALPICLRMADLESYTALDFTGSHVLDLLSVLCPISVCLLFPVIATAKSEHLRRSAVAWLVATIILSLLLNFELCTYLCAFSALLFILFGVYRRQVVQIISVYFIMSIVSLAMFFLLGRTADEKKTCDSPTYIETISPSMQDRFDRFKTALVTCFLDKQNDTKSLPASDAENTSSIFYPMLLVQYVILFILVLNTPGDDKYAKIMALSCSTALIFETMLSIAGIRCFNSHLGLYIVSQFCQIGIIMSCQRIVDVNPKELKLIIKDYCRELIAE